MNCVTVKFGCKVQPQMAPLRTRFEPTLYTGKTRLRLILKISFLFQLNVSYRAPVEKNYFLSLSRLSYGRETDSIRGNATSTERRNASSDTPTHRLVMHDLRGSWTQSNRTIVFGLFDSFVRNKVIMINCYGQQDDRSIWKTLYYVYIHSS